MGVRRAVDMVLDASKKYKGPIYTFGSLIHNPQVLNVLSEKGIRVINEVPRKGKGTVIIRAHGVPPETTADLKSAGFEVLDATCPRVVRVQTIIKKYTNKGYVAIIVGDRDHPEVVGLLGFAGSKGVVIGDLAEFSALPEFQDAIIIAQTTQNTIHYKAIKEYVRDRFPHYKIFDTICDSTGKRQKEVSRLAAEVDAMVVIGGYSSGNTKRLFEIACKSGKPAFHVETESDLNVNALVDARSIGITAGASTPNWVIRRIYRFLETMPIPGKHCWRRILFDVCRNLLYSNTYLAIGAGLMCYACSMLQGIETFFPHGLIPVFYVFSMHIFNNLTGRRADRYNDPEKSVFYDNHKFILKTLAALSGLAGIVVSFMTGWLVLFLFLFMSTSGILYNIRLIPKIFTGGKRGRIKDIPASKTLLIAIAWGITSALLPAFSQNAFSVSVSGFVFLWATGLIFIQTAFFDLLDIHGDRMVGRETLPIVMGENRTQNLLNMMTLLLMAMMITGSVTGLVSALGFVLSICPVYLLILLVLHQKGRLPASIRLEFLVKSHLILIGGVTWVYSFF